MNLNLTLAANKGAEARADYPNFKPINKTEKQNKEMNKDMK